MMLIYRSETNISHNNNMKPIETYKLFHTMVKLEKGEVRNEAIQMISIINSFFLIN